MYWRPWLDPRSVDWTDALNPTRIPGWAQNNNPYAWNALQKDAFYQSLRNAKGIEARAYVCPDPLTQLIPAGTTYDYEVPNEPNIWLWAVNASGSGADFLVQITDSETGATIFSQPINKSILNAQQNGTARRGPFYLLSTPHLFASPSYPVVRIINTDANPQTCRVNLFTCVEYDLLQATSSSSDS